MGKIYKGWELIKAIADGEIKNGSRFKAGYRTFIARDGYLFVEYENRQEYANSFELKWEFELIQDEIDIDSIEEIKLRPSDREYLSFAGLIFEEKINKLVQAVKQIDKKVKKLEKKKYVRILHKMK